MTDQDNITSHEVFTAFAGMGQPPRWLLLDERQSDWLHLCRVAVAVVMHDNLGWTISRVAREMRRNRANVARSIERYRNDPDVLEMSEALRAEMGLKHAYAQHSGYAA